MAAWPAVVGAILARANAVLPAVRVVRGHDVSENADDTVFVALQDINDEDWTSAGTFRQTMQSFGGAREEVGSVNCMVYARDGGGDEAAQAACTETALGYLAAIEADVRADETLGISGFDYVVAEMDSGEIREIQANGASTALPFVIAYKIRIT